MSQGVSSFLKQHRLTIGIAILLAALYVGIVDAWWRVYGSYQRWQGNDTGKPPSPISADHFFMFREILMLPFSVLLFGVIFFMAVELFKNSYHKTEKYLYLKYFVSGCLLGIIYLFIRGTFLSISSFSLSFFLFFFFPFMESFFIEVILEEGFMLGIIFFVLRTPALAMSPQQDTKKNILKAIQGILGFSTAKMVGKLLFFFIGGPVGLIYRVYNSDLERVAVTFYAEFLEMSFFLYVSPIIFPFSFIITIFIGLAGLNYLFSKSLPQDEDSKSIPTKVLSNWKSLLFELYLFLIGLHFFFAILFSVAGWFSMFFVVISFTNVGSFFYENSLVRLAAVFLMPPFLLLGLVILIYQFYYRKLSKYLVLLES